MAPKSLIQVPILAALVEELQIESVPPNETRAYAWIEVCKRYLEITGDLINPKIMAKKWARVKFEAKKKKRKANSNPAQDESDPIDVWESNDLDEGEFVVGNPKKERESPDPLETNNDQDPVQSRQSKPPIRRSRPISSDAVGQYLSVSAFQETNRGKRSAADLAEKELNEVHLETAKEEKLLKIKRAEFQARSAELEVEVMEIKKDMLKMERERCRIELELAQQRLNSGPN